MNCLDQESGVHGRTAVMKPLLKDTNKKKRQKQLTMEKWKSIHSLMSPNLELLARHRVSEQIDTEV